MEVKIQIPDSVWNADKDYPRFFEAIQQMVNRMSVSHFKYGPMAESQASGVDAALTGRQRLTMYDGKNRLDSCDCQPEVNASVPGCLMHSPACFLERRNPGWDGTGNTENLLDSANCFIIEHLFPRHPKAHFKAQESKDSPGLAVREEV